MILFHAPCKYRVSIIKRHFKHHVSIKKTKMYYALMEIKIKYKVQYCKYELNYLYKQMQVPKSNCLTKQKFKLEF